MIVGGWVRGLVAVATVSMVAVCSAQTSGMWRGRTELFWDAQAKQLVSRYIRVWDFDPGRDLDFYWEFEPGKGGVPSAAEPDISGRGRLIWYERGAAYYDREARRSEFIGTLAKGLAEGAGRLKTSDGLIYVGQWKAGRMDGSGVLHRPNGDRYEGTFTKGAMNGIGFYISANGDVLRGVYVEGRRDGVYDLTTANGRRWRSVWKADHEVSRTLTAPLQSARTDAEAVRGEALPVIIDNKANAKFANFDYAPSYVYYAETQGSEVLVSLDSPDVADLWKKSAEDRHASNTGAGDSGDYAPPQTSLVRDRDGYAPALLRIPLEKAAVHNVSGVSLHVSHSEPFLRPQIQAFEPGSDCKDARFSTTILLQNLGRGPVRSMTVTYSFERQNPEDDKVPPKRTRSFTTTTQEVRSHAEFSVAESVEALHVKLPKPALFRCTRREEENQGACIARAKMAGFFGDLENLVSDEGDVKLAGKADYDWTDAAGAAHTDAKSFEMRFPLLRLLYPEPEGVGECGAVTAQRRPIYPALLSDAKDDYDVAVPKKALQVYRDGIGIAVAAWEASRHHFQVVITNKDGTTQRSRPVDLYYFLPGKALRPSRR